MERRKKEMPYVQVIRKRGAKELSLSDWSMMMGLLKSSVASGVNEKMNPKTDLSTSSVHVYCSDMLGCQDAPELFVIVGFTTGGDLTPTPRENEALRIWVHQALNKSIVVSGMQTAVYIVPFPGASFGITERHLYAP